MSYLVIAVAARIEEDLLVLVLFWVQDIVATKTEIETQSETKNKILKQV